MGIASDRSCSTTMVRMASLLRVLDCYRLWVLASFLRIAHDSLISTPGAMGRSGADCLSSALRACGNQAVQRGSPRAARRSCRPCRLRRVRPMSFQWTVSVPVSANIPEMDKNVSRFTGVQRVLDDLVFKPFRSAAILLHLCMTEVGICDDPIVHTNPNR